MGTYRSETVAIDVPETATPAEAAAIVAALERRLSGEVEDDQESEPPWVGQRWHLAGRLEAIAGRPDRIPATAPRNAWTVAGRRDRY